MLKQKNPTDLHIQYKLETGDWYQWGLNGWKSNFHSQTGYSREYAQWLEEKLLEQLNS